MLYSTIKTKLDIPKEYPTFLKATFLYDLSYKTVPLEYNMS